MIRSRVIAAATASTERGKEVQLKAYMELNVEENNLSFSHLFLIYLEIATIYQKSTKCRRLNNTLLKRQNAL
jgi:hypothetical protein